MSNYDRYQFIKVEMRDGVALCTLNRPEVLNAIHGDMHRELEEITVQLAHDGDVRAIVLTGAGRAFSAGGDIRTMPGGGSGGGGVGAARAGGMISSVRDLIFNLVSIEQPVIAAVNGHAVGLGASIALACDVVFMADTARIGDPHVNVGLVAGDGGAVLWPLLVGPNRAKEYLFTGDLIPAAEAERIGLVNHVVPADKVLEEALAFATRLAKGPTLAIRLTKLSVQKMLKRTVLDVMEFSAAVEEISTRTSDHKEAVSAFVEKRQPKFEGR